MNQGGHNSPELWLYHRCAKALTIMQTNLTPLELSLNILNVLQTQADQDDVDEIRLQHSLFFATDGGKRRDLDLVFDVCARRVELRTKGVRERLMEAARVDATNEGENDSDENRGGRGSSATVRVQQKTDFESAADSQNGISSVVMAKSDRKLSKPTKVKGKTPNQPSDLEKNAPASLETDHNMEQEQCHKLNDKKQSDTAHKKPPTRCPSQNTTPTMLTFDSSSDIDTDDVLAMAKSQPIAKKKGGGKKKPAKNEKKPISGTSTADVFVSKSIKF
jgi:hypothetical protein